jgi:hypothetical protein
MKKIQFCFTFLLMGLFASTELSAQRYSGSGTTGGVNRSLTGQYSGNKKKKQDQKTDEQYLDESIEKLSEELTLDNFQEAVIKQLLLDEEEKTKKIIAEDIPNDSKSQKMTASREILNGKIKEILNPEQREKFEKMGKKKKK